MTGAWFVVIVNRKLARVGRRVKVKKLLNLVCASIAGDGCALHLAFSTGGGCAIARLQSVADIEGHDFAYRAVRDLLCLHEVHADSCIGGLMGQGRRRAS